MSMPLSRSALEALELELAAVESPALLSALESLDILYSCMSPAKSKQVNYDASRPEQGEAEEQAGEQLATVTVKPTTAISAVISVAAPEIK